jgi:hypothetical protein
MPDQVIHDLGTVLCEGKLVERQEVVFNLFPRRIQLYLGTINLLYYTRYVPEDSTNAFGLHTRSTS